MPAKSTRRPATSPFIVLPSELLGCILSKIDTARDLSNLSLTCKALYTFIETHGYRIFIRSRFPSIHLPSFPDIGIDDSVDSARGAQKFWKDAAHGLTTLSRNLDRRSFVAQDIRDPGSHHNGENERTFPGRRWYGQTMGFVPVIDSYEAWHGGDWASRKEVAAWGAGAKLVVRSRNMGPRREEEDIDNRPGQAGKSSWQIYLKEGLREGVDDITTLNLLPRESDREEEILIGRASRGLERILMDGKTKKRTLATYETGGMPVRYATVHRHNKAVAAACLGDHTVAFYSLKSEGEDTEPFLQTSIQKSGNFVRAWSASFLREGRLAVGLGRSDRPISIFDLGQNSHTLDRVIETPLDENTKLSLSDGNGSNSPGTSVYSIAALSPSSTSSGAEGDVFLSGAYDANIRLHDLRLANTVVSLYSDPFDVNSAIYSLLPIGQERFIAGAAQHSLIKVFDLRMPGQRLYYAADAFRCSRETFPPEEPKSHPSPRRRNGQDYSSTPQRGSQTDTGHPLRKPVSSNERKSNQTAARRCSIWRRCSLHASIRKLPNWNVYLGTSSRESSVYSLSRPSSVSPIVYAGVQNCIMQIDIIAVMDHHPDRIYNPRQSPTTTSKSTSSLPAWPVTRAAKSASHQEMREWSSRWDPKNETLNLTKYEQSHNVKQISTQRPVRTTKYTSTGGALYNGLDERWSWR